MLDCRRVPLLWTAYILLPASGWGFFDGAPIGSGGAVALFAVWWTWRFHRLLPGYRILAPLVLAKLLFALVAVERGFEADYFANTQWMPPVERSTDFRSRAFTRIDPRLEFGGTAPAFPLYFIDDPRRGTAPFSVVWRGVMHASPGEGRRAFYLQGSGVEGEVWVDGVQSVHLRPTEEEADDRALWPAGNRRITVRLRVPENARRGFEAGFIDQRGAKHTLGEADVTARPYPIWRLFLDRVVGYVSTAIDVVLILILSTLFAIGLRRQITAANKTAIAWLGIMLAGLAFTMPVVHRLAGFGERRYRDIEWHARDLLLNGRLGGHPPAAYVAAASHAVFGESLRGLYLMQCVALGAIAVIVAGHARRIVKAVDLLVPPEPE